MIDDGIVAKAEITGYRQNSIRSPYACVYRYVDENGTKYIGTLNPPIYPFFKTKKEAEAH